MTKPTPLHRIAFLAACWAAWQADPTVPQDQARNFAACWRKRSSVELALLPESQRMFAAATQELIVLLASTAQGRQALADFGFEPFLEDIESP